MNMPADTVGPEIVPLGADGLLVRFATYLDDAANRAVLAFADHLDQMMPDGVLELSTTLSSVYVKFDPGQTDRDRLTKDLHKEVNTRDWLMLPEPPPKRRWRIPAVFGGDHGPQLAETAELLAMTEDEAVADLVSHPVRVLAIGFAPGQPYLGMLPDRWNIPRLQAITPQVPAGALVVAVRQLIVFSNASPTGWRQVGQTAFRPYRAGKADPFPLLPGDELNFEPVSNETFDRIAQNNVDGLGGAQLENIE